MVSSIELSTISLHINTLKKSVSERYGVNWSEYMILVAVYKYEQQFGYATSKDVKEELDLNKDWIYRTINALEERDFLEITCANNPWSANSLNVTILGKIMLSYAERKLKEMVHADEERTY